MRPMKALFYFGWVLLVFAFAAGAAAVIPRTLPGGGGVIVSAYDLWYAAWPGSLITTQIKVERSLPWLWDPLLVTLLAWPAWLLFGLPGGLLAWYSRPNKEMSAAEREDLAKQEESFRLYDQLAREARESGIDEAEDDQLPDHGSHDVIDGRGLTTVDSDYDMNVDLAGDEEAAYAEGLVDDAAEAGDVDKR